MRYFSKAMLVASAAFCLNLSAYSQDISLKINNVTVKEAMERLKKDTGYSFVFSSKDVNTSKRVSISVNDATIEDVVKQILKGQQSLEYEIQGKKIILKRITNSPSKSQSIPGKVTGKVLDVFGEPIIGATVKEVGTTNGTISDLDGNFILEISDNSELEVSYIGFKAQKFQNVSGQNLSIVLKEDNEVLEEVVVVGYGVQKKADLTSSIATLNPSEVLKAPGGIESALQGNIAGVNVSGGKIRIRGTSSITGDTDPLWVVDGVIGGEVPNDDEIETIQVLKDAASAAIYGVRGANGVIVVTTKRGKSGAPQISFNSYWGSGTPSKKLKVLNAYDYAVYANELFYNAATPQAREDGSWRASVPSNNANPSNPMAETDWWDEYFFNNFYQKYDLAVSGGSDVLNYRLGATYTSDDKSGVERRNQSQNIYAYVQGTKGRFTYGGRLQLTYSNNKSTADGSLQNILQLPPNEPVYDENNKDINGGYYQTGMGDGLDIPNQVFFIHEDRNKTKSYRGIANVFGELKIFDWLKFKLSYTYSYYSSNYQRFRPKFVLASGGGGGVQNYNLLETTNSGNSRQQVEGLFTFDKDFGNHNISGIAGLSSETYYTYTRGFSGRSQEQTDFGVENLFQDDVSSSGTITEEAYYSVLARLMYSYSGKYMFTANFRADESSKFAKGNRWGYFPSFSIGWRISEEPWMKKLTDNWMTNLKIRATLGWIGSAGGVGNYAYQSVVNTVGYTYSFGKQSNNSVDSSVPAPRPSSIANRNLSWETTCDMGVGFDLGAFRDRLTITFDYYKRNVKDMLLNVQLPNSVGAGSSVVMNAGSMTNWGIELQATWRDKVGDFEYSVSPNFSFYRNNVTDLGNAESLVGGFLDQLGTNVTKTVVGQPVAQFWGYRTDGLFKTDDEAINYVNSKGERLQPSAAAGDLKFVDLNNDGKISEEDKTFIGSSIPTASVGLNLSFGYKGFDLSMLFQGDLGIDVYNNYKSTLLAGKALHNQLEDIKDCFRATDVTFTTAGGETIHLPANTDTDIPRVISGDPNQNSSRASDYFVEDASYIRCNNITLGYSFNTNVLSKLKISRLRIYAGVKNPFTITGYSMLDPQVPNGGATLDRGVDGRFYTFVGYYSQREFFAGVQLSF